MRSHWAVCGEYPNGLKAGQENTDGGALHDGFLMSMLTSKGFGRSLRQSTRTYGRARMNIPARISLVILLSAAAAGCAPYKNTRVLEAEERLLVYTETTTGAGATKVTTGVMCPEPSPDALKTLAASMNIEKQDVAAIAAAYSEGGANIGLRTHSIQLLRDQLFSICQAYANNAITKPAYQMLLTRNQRNTVALMAVEQLTGVLRSPSVTLAGSSSVSTNKDLIASLEKNKEQAIKAYEALSAEEKKKKEEVHKAELADYEKKIKEAKDKIITAVVAAESTPGANAGLDPKAVDKVADTVKHITDQVNDVNDLFYICLDVMQTIPANGQAVPAELDATCRLVFKEAGNILVKSMAATEGVGERPSSHMVVRMKKRK